MHQSSLTHKFNLNGLEQGVLSSIFADIEMRNATQVSGQYAVSDMHDMRIVRAKTYGGKFQVARQSHHILREMSASVFVCVPLFGEATLKQNGQKCVLARGDLGLLDSRFEYEIDITDRSDTLWLRLTATEMEMHLQDMPAILARRFDGSGGLGLIASRFVRSIASEAGTLRAGFTVPLSSITADLISAVTGNKRVNGTLRQLSAGQKTLQRAKDFIEHHLEDEDLRPVTIAKGVGISTRYLSELFASNKTTIMSWVMSRRLAACLSILETQTWMPGVVTDVALAHGFGSIPSFNRAFKNAYGKAPRQFMLQRPVRKNISPS
jgi:AraC-like DNA-binding protein